MLIIVVAVFSFIAGLVVMSVIRVGVLSDLHGEIADLKSKIHYPGHVS
jgi:hypothetical protein